LGAAATASSGSWILSEGLMLSETEWVFMSIPVLRGLSFTELL
jgi:hypothetical protein